MVSQHRINYDKYLDLNMGISPVWNCTVLSPKLIFNCSGVNDQLSSPLSELYLAAVSLGR